MPHQKKTDDEPPVFGNPTVSTVGGCQVIAPEQKQHYIRMMEIIIERSINPTLEKLNHAPIDL